MVMTQGLLLHRIFVQFLGNFLKLIYFSVSLKFNFKILVKYITSKKAERFSKIF